LASWSTIAASIVARRRGGTIGQLEQHALSKPIGQLIEGA
jgi:hypothetical protein